MVYVVFGVSVGREDIGVGRDALCKGCKELQWGLGLGPSWMRVQWRFRA